jgi:hypothetical protein
MADHSDPASCPYCFAEIDPQARKCCFCGEWVQERKGRAKVPREEGGARPAHEAITESFDEAVRDESMVFAVITLVVFFILPVLGFLLALVGVFSGPRRGCFGAMLVLFVLLPLALLVTGVAFTGGMAGGLLHTMP